MKLPVAGISLLLAMHSSAAVASDAQNCVTALSAPRVVVSAPVPQLQVSQTLDMKGLSRIAAGRHDTNTLGLTQFGVRVTAERRARELQTEAGLCASRALTLHIDVPVFVVHIASEVPAGSCLYEEVLEHEMRHVEIAQATHKLISAQLTVSAQSWAGSSAWFGPPEAVKQWLESEPLPDYDQQARALLVREETKHRLIDTPQEYRRLGTVCQGAAAAIFLKSRVHDH